VLRDGLIFLSESEIARRFATHAPGARGMARRFVAGETVEDGIRAAHALNQAGLKVTLDYLGEAVRSRVEARAAADTYVRLIDRIAEERLDANVSLKLTQMGQDIDDAFLRETMVRVLERARAADLFVRFDMESSAYTQRTIDFFRALWDEGWTNCGIVLQSYLKRSDADARMANALGARVRLCKGAYREPPTVAFQDRADVDRNFVALAELLLTEGVYPGIATHDDAMIRATLELAERHGIPADRFEFQLLYGVRRDRQHQLRDAGYNVRVYVPFGEAWYPYLMRRLAERPANLMLVVRAVLAESPFRFLVRDGK
jgi:proline dehydrogenase